MVRVLSIAIVVLTLTALGAGQTFYGTTDLAVFRDGRDKEFRNRAESPLKAADFAVFKGLNYFSTDDKFRVTAELIRTPDEKVFQMPTSAGTTRRFEKYGVLRFTLADKSYTLNIYRADAETRTRNPEYADLLFIPFRDQTNGTETYGAGRYIDIKTPKGDQVTLDFNLAYNPNCAYGRSEFSCPVPPKENFLHTRVTAGEMSYKQPAEQQGAKSPTIHK
jgi:uncharacterized protein